MYWKSRPDCEYQRKCCVRSSIIETCAEGVLPILWGRLHEIIFPIADKDERRSGSVILKKQYHCQNGPRQIHSRPPSGRREFSLKNRHEKLAYV